MQKNNESLPPAELNQLLKILISVPTNISFTNLSKVLNDAFREKTGRPLTFEDTERFFFNEDIEEFSFDRDYSDSIRQVIKIIRKEIMAYKELYEYIFEEHFDETVDDFEILARYNNFTNAYETLKYAAKQTNYYQKTGKRMLLPALFFEYQTFAPYLEITQEGRAIFVIGKTLLNIDAKRLRVCEVCGRVYWAKKIEKSTDKMNLGCSPKHNSVLRTAKRRNKVKNRFQPRFK